MSDGGCELYERASVRIERLCVLIGGIQANVEMARRRYGYLPKTPEQAIADIAKLIAEYDAERGEDR